MPPQNAILWKFESPRVAVAAVLHSSVGEWLSLVEHLVRDQGVGGSNPLSPTISNQQLPKSPGMRGLPKGLTFALPARVAPKTRATPSRQPCSQLQLFLPTRCDCRHFGSRLRWRVPCCPASLPAGRQCCSSGWSA